MPRLMPGRRARLSLPSPLRPARRVQVPEWLLGTTAPVLYFEQGHEWLFGDPLRFQEAGNGVAQDQARAPGGLRGRRAGGWAAVHALPPACLTPAG